MAKPATKPDRVTPSLEYGLVIEDEGEHFVVHTDEGRVFATKAVSCLVSPRNGDYVLLSTDSFENGFILSVLARDSEAQNPTDILIDGPLNLHVKDGSVSLTADRDMDLAAKGELAWTSSCISVHADEGRADIGKMSFVGQFLRSQVERIKLAADSVDHVFRQWTQRLGNSFRVVEEHEEVQSGSTRHLVDGTMTVHAKNTVHIAEEDVKIDAEQIHLG